MTGGLFPGVGRGGKGTSVRVVTERGPRGRVRETGLELPVHDDRCQGERGVLGLTRRTQVRLEGVPGVQKSSGLGLGEEGTTVVRRRARGVREMGCQRRSVGWASGPGTIDS